MSVKLLTEHHLEFLSLKGGCTGSSESTYVKLPHCWKSRVMALLNKFILEEFFFVYCERLLMQYILTESRYANLVENHLFTLMKVSLILPLNLAKQKNEILPRPLSER